MKKIAVVTTTRAEYGILTPLIRKINEDDELKLNLIVSGGHLSKKQGHTVDEIYKDGFPISHEIEILEDDNSPYGVSVTMANAIKGFAKCFRDDRPDMVIILGDRTEMLGIVSAAMNERIPIAHLHGGEITKGAVDDCVRHALTKMSYLHFTSTEVYRNRVIRMGESPDRVFNVGSLSVENIMDVPLMNEAEFRKNIGINDAFKDMPLVVTTFHPVTIENNTAETQVMELCRAMEDRPGYFYLITKANTDTGGDRINLIFEKFVKGRDNTMLVSSLGMVRYLSAVKYAAFVLGNSSSGIGEAPVCGTPTVNIGDRQKGRLMAETVVCCEPQEDQIVQAMDTACLMKHYPTNMYGDGKTSQKIVEIIKRYLFGENIDLKKGFYDL